MLNLWTPSEQAYIARLYALADVTDRAYAVRSMIPLLGPLVVWLRRNLTTHLREAYFDPIVERQVLFNRKLADALCAAWQFLKERAVDEGNHFVAPEVQRSAAARELLEQATMAAAAMTVFNALLWAGPLPEYGECLGKAFYQALYAASLASMSPVSETQKKANLQLLENIRQLAQKIEARPRWMAKFYTESLVPDVMLRDYRVHSSKRFIGPLIGWLRCRLTAHLKEAYLDPTLERQVTFNRRFQAALHDATALERASVTRLRVAADTVVCPYRVCSSVPLLGLLIVWLRRWLTAHIDVPYIIPILERQAAFNRTAVEVLALIQQQAADLRGCESAVGSLFELAYDLAELQARVESLTQTADAQEEFNTLVGELVSRMQTWIAEVG